MLENVLKEWSTYSITDFLLFSPRAYYRMLALYNRAIWPAHVLTFAATVWSLIALRSGTRRDSTGILLLLALAWAWLAWGFHLERYATINWAAVYAGIAFVIEAIFLAAAALTGSLTLSWPRLPLNWLGLALYLFALLPYPLLALFSGRGWSQAEVFALAPDPTALGTLGLLFLGNRMSLLLMPIPLLWCLVASLTLYGLGAPEAWIMAFGAALALAALFLDRQPRRNGAVPRQ
jgi:hypothetical protein